MLPSPNEGKGRDVITPTPTSEVSAKRFVVEAAIANPVLGSIQRCYSALKKRALPSCHWPHMVLAFRSQGKDRLYTASNG